MAAGYCAANCEVFAGSYAFVGPVSSVIPVDLHIGGCPPSPTALLNGLVAVVDQMVVPAWEWALRRALRHYRPTTRLTTMAAIPASTALAIGDASIAPIWLDSGACPRD